MLRQLHLCNLGLEDDSTSLDSDTVFSCMVHLDFPWHVVYQVVVIIKPLQRWLRHNQSLTFYSWGADVTVKFPKQLSLFFSLIFWLYLLCPSVPWVIWASPHTGVRVESCLNATSEPSIRTQNRKVLCNIWAFRWWCADVSPFRGKEDRNRTHRHHLCCNMHKVCLLYAYHSQLISANGADLILYSVSDKSEMWDDGADDGVSDWIYVSVWVSKRKRKKQKNEKK